MGVKFTFEAAQRIIRGVRSIEGMRSGQHTAPPRSRRHPRRVSDPNDPDPDGRLRRIRFRTTAAMASRSVAAVVTWAGGDAQVVAGDAVTIHDPQNLHPNVAANATGMAFWMPQDDGPPIINARWEAEWITEPICRVEGYIDTCQPKSTAPGGTAYVHTNNQLEYLPANEPDAWKLSHKPNVDLPPEFTEETSSGNIRYSFPFTNPRKLDVVSKTYVASGSGGTADYFPCVFERRTKGVQSDPTNTTIPKDTNLDAAYEWVLVSGEQYARWIRGTVTATAGQSEGDTPSNVTITDYGDGGDPRACGTPNVVLGFDVKCNLTERYYAVRNPEQNRYEIVAVGELLPTPEWYTYEPDLEIKQDSYGNYVVCVDHLRFLAHCTPTEPSEDCWPGIECDDVT